MSSGAGQNRRTPPSRGMSSRKRARGSRGSTTSRASTESRPKPTSQPSSSCGDPGNQVVRSEGDNQNMTATQSSPDDTVGAHTSAAQDLVSPVELQEVTAERDEARETCNKYKQELQDMKHKLVREQCNNDLLREKVKVLQEQLNDAELKNKNLEALNIQLAQSTQTPGKKVAQRFLQKLSKSIDKNYLSLASAVERRLYDWAQAETMEVLQSEEFPNRRNWTGRMSVVQDFGIESRSSDNAPMVKFVPTLITSVLGSPDPYFIRSFTSYEDVISTIADSLLTESTWHHYATSPAVKENTLSVLRENAVMKGKVRQCLSDCISNRKRVVRDELFQTLRYFSLKSSHDRRREAPIFTREEEIKLVKEKLLGIPSSTAADSTINQNDLTFGAWREKRIEELTSDTVIPETFRFPDSYMHMDNPVRVVVEPEGDEINNSSDDINDQDINCVSLFGLFRNELSQQLWSQFIGFNPCDEGCGDLETSILSLTRLDAWFATVIELLQAEDKRGGGRQRDYSLSFHKNHTLALFSLTNRIYDFVNFWEPSELVVPSSDDDNPREAVCRLERTATIILENNENGIGGSFVIAVKSDWFKQYISGGMGIVHDCYIAKISNDWTEIHRLDYVTQQESTEVNPHNNTETRSMAHPSPAGLPDDTTQYKDLEDDDDVMGAPVTVPRITS